MPNMKSLSLMVQKLWPRLKLFATDRNTIRQDTQNGTGQNLPVDAPKLHSRGIKIYDHTARETLQSHQSVQDLQSDDHNDQSCQFVGVANLRHKNEIPALPGNLPHPSCYVPVENQIILEILFLILYF